MEMLTWYLVINRVIIEKTFAHRDQVYGEIDRK